MKISIFGGGGLFLLVGLVFPSRVDAVPSVPGVAITNPDWAIIMTPEGYSDVALDRRPGFDGREYLSGEWAAAVFYAGGSNPAGPIWLRKVWGFPCWTSNSNFSVSQEIQFASPPVNPDGFNRLESKVSNGDLEITMTYEMLNSVTGIEQGDVRASDGGGGISTTSSPYVFRQTYHVENVSGANLTAVRFYQFLHGLKSGTSLYDDRAYPGPFGEYRYDNTQKGLSRSLNDLTGEIYSHADTICMHAMDLPSAFECGYYGKEGVDDHINGKPSVGVHLSVEADSLDGTDFFDPPEERWVSGAMCFDFPDLAAGATHEITVLLSILSESVFVAAPPVIEILDVQLAGPELLVDFMETTGAPLDGFLLWSSKDLTGDFPDDWIQVAVPRFIDVPFPGASRYKIPVDPVATPKCFFRVQPFVE